MTQQQWLYRRGELARDGWESVVDASTPGWAHTGLRVAELAPGEELAFAAAALERIVVPLAGSFVVEHDADGGATVELAGRPSVFDGPTDVLYLPSNTAGRVRATAAGASGTARVAFAEAPATESLPARHVRADEVAVELRGAGRASRQVHNFGTPGNLDAAKLIVCEVITPAENWSSYPAHKHDEDIPGHESALEEIYYFEAAPSRGGTAAPADDAFGMFATYSSPGKPIDINGLVGTGDVALVPYGYHGPAAAAPNYDLYYLNVMAGPGSERAWLISDDPAQTWVRETWSSQDVDSRLPYLNEGTR
ncbi:MAG: 5-deoxy-glucuronate isomerase [Agromyces sp.]